MRGLSRFLTGLFIAAVALTVAAVAPARPAKQTPTIAAERTVDGIRLIAMAPPAGTASDISVLPPDAGLDRIAAALALIQRKSPATAAVLRRLKAAGPVSLVYFPNNFRDRNRLNTQTVALFMPDFLTKSGLAAGHGTAREFNVVINQFGVKWPADELAAVIVHELAGHGVQHVENRIAGARPLDLECEASLLQERAYQEFGVAKKTRSVVLFRRQMEFHYCADFRAYMKDRMPAKMALWDALDPDVPALLGAFSVYRGTQTAARPAAPAISRSR